MIRECKLLLLSILAGFIFTAGVGLADYSERLQSDISNEVLRFHVLANSDSDQDQALKLRVKERVLEEYSSALRQSESLDATKQYLSECTGDIKALAENVVKSEGYDYPISVSLEKAFFPTKAYGDFTFPPGEYDALRIEIGEAEGRNWWCMLFPPLCYVDIAKSDESKEGLKNVLTDDEYDLLVSDSVPVKLKFKIVELWQNAKKTGISLAFWEDRK